MGCESCEDAAKERMKGLDDAKDKAKNYAHEINAPVAICKDEQGNYFITAGQQAIEQRFAIVQFVSNL